MRLLFVSHSFPPVDQPLANVGGMQRVATELYAVLERRADVELESVVLRTSWRLTHLKTIPFLGRAYRRIAKLAEEDAVDAVLFSSMVTAAIAPLLRCRAAARDVPMAAIVHGRDVTLPFWPYQEWVVPRVFDALDAVLPVSRATGAAARLRGLPSRKLHVVPNGVDTTRFAAPSDRPAARQTLLDTFDADLPDHGLLLCSVGRQVERKGFAWFAREVMPLLPDDVYYWLAGDGPEGENIEAAARRHGLGNRVRQLGRIPEEELRQLYRGADLFVMPNVPVEGDMEGFGIVMLEAGLSGLPTVAARLEGIQDVIEEEQNGHLVPTQDPGAFREAILHYYNDRPALVEASRRAARYTDETFSWEAVAGRYVDVLSSLARPQEAPAAA